MSMIVELGIRSGLYENPQVDMNPFRRRLLSWAAGPGDLGKALYRLVDRDGRFACSVIAEFACRSLGVLATQSS